MDFDDINIAGLIFGVVGFGIGIIVSNSMGSGIFLRVMAGLICGVVCYLIGGKIVEN